MVVLTLLTTGRQLDRLSAAIPAPHEVLRVSSVNETCAVLRERPVDVLVMDPAVGNSLPRVAASAAELFRIGIEFPYLPVVFYASNAAKALPLIARFPSREHCDALVADADDGPEGVCAAIESALNSSLAGRLLRGLQIAADEIPPSLCRALREVFTHPGFFRTADDIANSACMSRRTLDRWLARCALVSGGELLQVAKALVAVRLERDGLLGRDGVRRVCGLSAGVKVGMFVARATRSRHEELVQASDV